MVVICKQPSCQLKPACPFSSDVSYQQGTSACRAAAHWMHCFSHHSVQTLETIVYENPRRLDYIIYYNTQTSLTDTNIQVMVKVTEVTPRPQF